MLILTIDSYYIACVIGEEETRHALVVLFAWASVLGVCNTNSNLSNILGRGFGLLGSI